MLYFGNKDKGTGTAVSFSNKRVLAEKTGISYSRLTRLFTREKRNYVEIPEEGYVIIRSRYHFKGRQRVIKQKN